MIKLNERYFKVLCMCYICSMTKAVEGESDISTEQKIKDAARKVFMKKGFKATRTRDIADEAGINLALLNYYFRKKEMLFDVIVKDILEEFLDGLKNIFNDESTTIEQKFLTQAERYTEMLTANPHLPLFVLSELQINPSGFVRNYKIENLLIDSFFYKQLTQQYQDGKLKITPVQLLTNFLSLIMFPFAGSPILKASLNLNDTQFKQLIDERKTLISDWLVLMMR